MLPQIHSKNVCMRVCIFTWSRLQSPNLAEQLAKEEEENFYRFDNPFSSRFKFPVQRQLSQLVRAHVDTYRLSRMPCRVMTDIIL